MASLTVELVKNNLLKEDEVKKARAATMKVNKATRGNVVGKPKDLSSKLTKIKQIEVKPGTMKDSNRSKSQIPQADRADKIVDKMDHGLKSDGSGNDKIKTPSVAKTKTDNQTTKLSQVKKPIKNTESKGMTKTFMPQSDFASTYVYNLPHGSSNLGGKNKSDGEPKKKPPVAQAYRKASTKPGDKTVKANFKDRTGKSAPQVKSTTTKLKGTSDEPKKPKISKVSTKSSNVIESGVVLTINGKVKNKFDIVSHDVLDTMVETYENYGYEVGLLRTNDVTWKNDRKFMRMLREMIDAKYNFVPKHYKEIRKQALQYFHNISKSSYNSLYESRNQFASIVVEAFKEIEKRADNQYVSKLEIFECLARVEDAEETLIDIELITEATGHDMALRQTYSSLMESMGLDIKVKHIFVDGKKYDPSKIKNWSPES